MTLVSEYQRRLRDLGIYAGDLDGDWGPMTQAAAEAHQRKLGNFVPPWIVVAGRELGMREVPGARNNPRIVEYARHTTLKASDDETAWCSAFENYIMDIAGLDGTHSAGARSWENWGMPIAQPRFGCLAVFYRGSRSSGLGHITNWVYGAGGRNLFLGGNQGDAVSVEEISTEHLIGYRWPSAAQLAKPINHLAA